MDELDIGKGVVNRVRDITGIMFQTVHLLIYIIYIRIYHIHFAIDILPFNKENTKY